MILSCLTLREEPREVFQFSVYSISETVPSRLESRFSSLFFSLLNVHSLFDPFINFSRLLCFPPFQFYIYTISIPSDPQTLSIVLYVFSKKDRFHSFCMIFPTLRQFNSVRYSIYPVISIFYLPSHFNFLFPNLLIKQLDIWGLDTLRRYSEVAVLYSCFVVDWYLSIGR